MLMGMTLFGWLLGMQNARATLMYALVQNAVNIVLDLVFVFVFDMGVFGVALASVIAQYSGMLLGLVLVRLELKRHPGQWLPEQFRNLEAIQRMLSLNRNIFIRTLCLIFVFAFFARQGARQGDVILAANAVLMNFQAVTALGLDGFANAVEALVGKAIGANDRRAFRNAIFRALYWSLLVSAMFSIIYLLTGKWMIMLMTDIENVMATATQYLPWLIAAPLISVWCFLLDGVFIGAVRGREMRNSMLISTILVFLPGWYWLTPLGNNGLWLALMIFSVPGD